MYVFVYNYEFWRFPKNSSFLLPLSIYQSQRIFPKEITSVSECRLKDSEFFTFLFDTLSLKSHEDDPKQCYWQFTLTKRSKQRNESPSKKDFVFECQWAGKTETEDTHKIIIWKLNPKWFDFCCFFMDLMN